MSLEAEAETDNTSFSYITTLAAWRHTPSHPIDHSNMGNFDPVFVNTLKVQSWSLYSIGVVLLLLRL